MGLTEDQRRRLRYAHIVCCYFAISFHLDEEEKGVSITKAAALIKKKHVTPPVTAPVVNCILFLHLE